MKNMAKGDGTIDTDTLPRRSTDQESLDTKHRRQTLVEILGYAKARGLGLDTVVELAWLLGVEVELAEMLDSTSERQRRYQAELKAMAAELGLELAELKEISEKRQ